MAKKIARTTETKKFGAGIDALFSPKIDQEIRDNPEKVVRELSNVFAMIPISQIEANPDQPRKEFDPEALRELSESIKLHGIIQPMTVRRLSAQEYQIISGERRFRASQLAGLTEVPAYIRIANDQAMLEMAIIENIQREDLNPFEIAVSYYRLKEECLFTDEQLAERVGKKRSTVTNYLRLLDLHIEVVEALKNDTLSMGHGRAIAGVSDKLLQKKVLDKVMAAKLSVRDTEKLAREYSLNTKKKKPADDRLPDGYQLILDDFRAFFGTKRIQITLEDPAVVRGQIVIPFSNNKELTEFFKIVEQ